MAQNTSTAVMQRRVAGTDTLDFYPTPPWATRALIEHVLVPMIGREKIADMICWEPAAGHGDMARPLAEYFGHVVTSDIHDHGDSRVKHRQHDFLMPYLPDHVTGADWIITNPPFALAERFIARAQEIATGGVAMLVRSAFLEGQGRYERLYRNNPPTVVAQFTERVVMHHGKLSPTGSTATAYCWVTWGEGLPPRPFQWIPPCRKSLERASDYPSTSDGGPSPCLLKSLDC